LGGGVTHIDTKTHRQQGDLIRLLLFLENKGSGLKIYLKTEVSWEEVDWIHLSRDRDEWRALLPTTELRVQQQGEQFLAYLKDYQQPKNSASCS
jgi:hypothetical protein